MSICVGSAFRSDDKTWGHAEKSMLGARSVYDGDAGGRSSVDIGVSAAN